MCGQAALDPEQKEDVKKVSEHTRRHSSRVPAATNVLRILTLLTSIDVPVSAARIYTELDLPRSTVYHLLTVMEDAGYVVRLPEEKTYGLGVAAYAMASAYTTQQPLVRVGARHAKFLAELIGGSAHISKLSGSDVLYILEERSKNANSLLFDAGVRIPAFITASGMAMLSLRSEQQVKATYSTSPVPNHMSFREVIEQLAIIRERGWAEENERIDRAHRSFSAPILDHLGQPAAALAVSFHIDCPVDPREILGEVRTRAELISHTVFGHEH